MAIVLDAEKDRIIDADNGESLKIGPSHWQDPYLHCTICAEDGSPLFAADVERNAIDETGNGGGATLVRYVVRNAWFPSGNQEKPTHFLGHTGMIDRLREFMLARHNLSPKTPHPRFEFWDRRLPTDRVNERW